MDLCQPFEVDWLGRILGEEGDSESVSDGKSAEMGFGGGLFDGYSSPAWDLIGMESAIQQRSFGEQRNLDSADPIVHGKNGNALVRLWRRAERDLLRAEFLYAWSGVCGGKSKLIEWQISESWKQLMLAQSKRCCLNENVTNGLGYRFAQTSMLLSRDIIAYCEGFLSRSENFRGFQNNSGNHGKVEKQNNGLVFQYRDSEFAASISLADGQLESLSVGKTEFLSAPIGIPVGWYANHETRVNEHENMTLLVTPLHSEYGDAVLKWTILHGDFSVSGQITFQLNTFPNKKMILPIRTSFEEVNLKSDKGMTVYEPDSEEVFHHHFCYMYKGYDGLLYTSDQSSLALRQNSGVDSVLYDFDNHDLPREQKSFTIDFALSPMSHASNNELFEESFRIIEGRNENDSKFSFGEFKFMDVQTDACISSVRLVGSELEVRLFDANLVAADAVITFPWEISRAYRVDLTGKEVREQPFSKNVLAIALEPLEICTVRVQLI